MEPKISANIDEPWDEMVLRCAVGCDDFMVFTVENLSDEGDDDWWVEVSLVADMRPHSFWEMLQACWALFRRGRWHRASADLSRAHLISVAEWCTETLKKMEPA